MACVGGSGEQAGRKDEVICADPLRMPITLADLEITPVDPAVHNLQTFDCDDSDLNDFLRNDCQSYQGQCLSHTRVAIYKGALVGFVTLLADSIILQTSEKKHLFDFHKKVMYFPAMKIGRLGVAQRLHHGGVGRSLLKYSLGVAVRMNADLNVGCRFITVDAYPRSIDWYKKNGFVFNKEYKHPDKTNPSMRYDILASPQII